MAYTPKTWENGEIIEAEELNHMEQGIATADQSAAEAQETADEAKAIVAGEFLTTKTYTTGEYCIYSGTLYRFTADKTAGAWDSTKVVSGALANDVSKNKSAIMDNANGLYPIQLNVLLNKYITNQGVLASYNGWDATDYIPCEDLSAIYIHAGAASNYNAWYSDKDENAFISQMPLSNGDNIVAKPTNAKYFRLSNTHSALNSTYVLDFAKTEILETQKTIYTVNCGLKNIGAFILKEYVDNSTGNFVSSASYKRTDFIDISEYSGSIYFVSNYRSPYCCFYDSGKNKVSSFIVPVGESLVEIPSTAKYCAFSLSRYNDAEIVIYDNTYSALKALEIGNIRDINLKYLPRTDILTQMIRKPLFIVFTDIHGSENNMKRMTDFYNKNLLANVWYPINLGDTVEDQATDSISFADTDLGKAALTVIGNHDLLVSGSLPGITSKQAYDKYIAPNVDSWDVAQPSNAATNGYNYYYKDKSYSGGTIRLIVLDEYFYDETQHNWFVATLADANTNGYSVIVCQHQSNVLANQASPLDNKKAFATPELGFDLYVTTEGYSGAYASANEARIMAVDDFIGDGGKFICWMSGHTHSDQCHTFERTHGKQLSLVFSNAGMSMTSSNRVANYSADCFQYVAVDLSKSYIYVLRIGESVDKWFHKNEFICYDYENFTVKEYH